ncbi:ribosome small subunit-dependent GTPase A [Kineococcus rhizosphaerae]|uniref:Small ribosomal subunit biogenesis GTPase RsgA n=1 Tax=Kineococcus rhizosphaerae TaxID=559628 RepID=A0A2T0R1U5_9ACTN|nr:ribosome small subunit-dependent GTPase A [Kineococcus rhizosphaerae]PRY13483.1 ribosome biogenesis GTPase [Kineococcus rhizosphaerae]
MQTEVNPTDPLVRFGWDDDWTRRWAAFQDARPEQHLLPARVVRVHRGACDVETPLGPQRVEIPAGHLVPGPTTGDWVGLSLDGPDGARAVGVLPRRTVLARASVTGRSAEHQLAANVDTVVVAIGAESRTTLGRVERFLALAWNSGAQPVVALTKSDLLDDAELDEVLDRVRADAVGVQVVPVRHDDPASVAALRDRLRGTVVLLGSSGAGKSTLANLLVGEDRFAVGDVRSVDGKGRHTTVTRELVPVPGGLVLVDTPGLRSLGVAELGDALGTTFADVADVAVDCRFSDCSHTSEPGCAVLSAIGAGVFDQRRLDSFRKLEREQAWFASRTDARLAAERRREWKKVVRAHRDRHA